MKVKFVGRSGNGFKKGRTYDARLLESGGLEITNDDGWQVRTPVTNDNFQIEIQSPIRKVTIESDDENEIYFALNGGRYWVVLWGIDQHCRTRLKSDIDDSETRVYNEIREKIREFCDDNNINLDV